MSTKKCVKKKRLHIVQSGGDVFYPALHPSISDLVSIRVLDRMLMPSLAEIRSEPGVYRL